MKRAPVKSNCAFIDAQNLLMGIQSQGWEIDLRKFRIFLRDKYQVKQIYIFVGYLKENQRFYDFLESIGYLIVFKPTVRYRENGRYRVKGNVDIELAIKVLLEYDNFNKAVIVSGDGDFYTLIKHLEINNKLLRILTPNKRYSSLLKEFNMYITDINLLREKLKI